MINFTFKLAGIEGEDLKPAVPVQVQAENLASAKTKINTLFTTTNTCGTLISAQEIPEIESE